MNRFLFTVTGRNFPKAVSAIATTFHPSTSWSRLDRTWGLKRYSIKASEIKKIVPEFWIRKMKTVFAWHDMNGDGYMTGEDFAIWITEMGKLFPDMNEEQRKTLEAKHGRLWGDLLEGKGKGPDYKVTESIYMEKFFNIAGKEGAEDMMRNEWRNNFSVMDTNKDGLLSKAEHRRFFEANKRFDPNGAIVAFSAIDKDMDGFIGRDEFVEAAMEFLFNFSDETKPSKHFFGPLVKM